MHSAFTGAHDETGPVTLNLNLWDSSVGAQVSNHRIFHCVLLSRPLLIPREAHVQAEVLEQRREVSSRFSEKNQVVELLNPVAFLQQGTEPLCKAGTPPEQGLQSITATSPSIPTGFVWPGFSGVLQTFSHTAVETTGFKRHLVVEDGYFILIRQSLPC